jgi:type II secretory pathway component PulK
VGEHHDADRGEALLEVVVLESLVVVHTSTRSQRASSSAARVPAQSSSSSQAKEARGEVECALRVVTGDHAGLADRWCHGIAPEYQVD